MVRKFLLMLFDTFLILVIFISLFQYSGASVTGFNNGIFDTENTYFGFYSLISFFTDLGNNTDIMGAWNNFMKFFNWIIERFQEAVNSWKESIDSGFNLGLHIINAIKALYQTLLLPVWAVAGVLGFVIYLLVFVFNIFKAVFLMLQGKYNLPLNNASESISEVLRYVSLW